jgi:hypothetical protein
VSGILKGKNIGKSMKFLITLIEQSSLVLLDNTKSSSEQEKTMDFIKMNFKICLESVLKSEVGSEINQENVKAQAIVLKMTTLVRSLKDSSALQ